VWDMGKTHEPMGSRYVAARSSRKKLIEKIQEIDADPQHLEGTLFGLSMERHGNRKLDRKTSQGQYKFKNSPPAPSDQRVTDKGEGEARIVE